MTKLLYVFALLVLLAGIEPAGANHEPWRPSSHALGLHDGVTGGLATTTAQYDANTSQGRSRDVIPPSVALRVALSYSPGSQGLGVDLLQGRRLVYAVKLKTGNRVHRVLVDALTGQIVGD